MILVSWYSTSGAPKIERLQSSMVKELATQVHTLFEIRASSMRKCFQTLSLGLDKAKKSLGFAGFPKVSHFRSLDGDRG